MKFNIVLVATALSALCLAGADAQAAPIVGLYSTGVDNAGVSTSGTASDLHWSLNGGSAYTSATNGTFPIGPWVPDSTTSRWITPTTNAADSFDPATNGTYDYTTSFDLAGISGASFAGQFAADNTVLDVLLNGHSLGVSGGDFTGWTNFASIAGDFVVGKNTLEFVVQNYAQNGGNPSGLNVNITSSTAGAVPEPAAWAMMIIGFFGLGTAVRRTKSNGAVVSAV
jgi:hypothetical protein